MFEGRNLDPPSDGTTLSLESRYCVNDGETGYNRTADQGRCLSTGQEVGELALPGPISDPDDGASGLFSSQKGDVDSRIVREYYSDPISRVLAKGAQDARQAIGCQVVPRPAQARILGDKGRCGPTMLRQLAYVVYQHAIAPPPGLAVSTGIGRVSNLAP
jgi:hypothetical protein